MIKGITYDLGNSIRKIFTGYGLLLQVLAVVVTYIIVIFGFDWFYYRHVIGFENYLFPAVVLGFLVPVSVPLALYTIGVIKKNESLTNAAYAVTQSEILGLLVSYMYKAFTGRAHPDPFVQSVVDMSREFHFGFLQRGVFWGWPSSHTTVAFAAAVALWILFPNKKVRFFVAAYALYIGIGVSGTIHWFSDFIAGALVGAAVGMVVGKTFASRKAL